MKLAAGPDDGSSSGEDGFVFNDGNGMP